MKKDLIRMLCSCIAFILSYITVDYLIDSKIDWSFAIGGLIGYTIIAVIFIFKNKKK